MLDPLVILVAVLVLVYTPISFWQVSLLLRRATRLPPARPSGLPADYRSRRVLVVVCTNGQNPHVVEKILATLESYRLPVERLVIKEERDPFRYSATEITVPRSYRTQNGSRTKERALQFGIEYLHSQGCGPETYICHLDDDSVVTREYLEYIFWMTEEAGQGSIRLREYGHSRLSTLADLIRVFDCDVWCSYFNRHHRPKAVHGEGLVIRADVEYAVGWDYATYCGEDFLMGQLIVARGYEFGHIPYTVAIAPPTNAQDFFKQRRRWMYGILWSRKKIADVNRSALLWVLYRYAAGWAGFVGLFPMIYGLVAHPVIPLWLVGLGAFNFASYCVSYQYGAWRTSPRYMPLVLILQLAVAMYEGLTLAYAVIRKPDRFGFEVIQKV